VLISLNYIFCINRLYQTSVILYYYKIFNLNFITQPKYLY